MHTYIYTQIHTVTGQISYYYAYIILYIKNVNSCSTQLNNGFDKLFI